MSKLVKDIEEVLTEVSGLNVTLEDTGTVSYLFADQFKRYHYYIWITDPGHVVMCKYGTVHGETYMWVDYAKKMIARGYFKD